ncbi:hypothetical protein LCGC14_2398290 [marine sediment metagenome]|uniref:Glycosyl transferase family 11 n=1 Tax=marine sediment metagenome TaxID=412755 RepID=A0A0F9EQH8_9ZZZZ
MSDKPSMFYTPNVLEKIRNYYYSTKKPDKPKFDIALHIRRGDVNNVDLDQIWRYTSNKVYIKIIQFLKNTYPDYSICIHSQGKINDFKELFFENVHFSLNDSIDNTFHNLVTSKILVMSKSSFSYSAALLSTNIVYYIPFWHKTLDNWLTIDNLELWLEEFDQKYDYRKRLIYMQQFKTNKKFDQKYD